MKRWHSVGGDALAGRNRDSNDGPRLWADIARHCDRQPPHEAAVCVF
ncbi:MAG: hypothetical protein AAFW95_00500 [Cyanobacteria bacterium J06638_6]